MWTMSTETGAEQTTRRTFYISVIYSLWGLIVAALAVPSLVYLLFPPKVRKESEWVEAGDITHLEPKVPIEIVFRRNRLDGWKLISEKSSAWVVKLPNNEIVAFGPQCTHLACVYHWEEPSNQFFCPCHSSAFSLEGQVLSGPAPRPLDRYEIKVEKNKLLLGSLHKSFEIAE